MNMKDILAEGVLSTKPLLERYLAGFDDANRTRQPAGMPNHAAWTLGHLAITMHRVSEKLDGKGPPATDFCAGPRGNLQQFAGESVAFGSQPIDDPNAYPHLVRCVGIYESACERLAHAVRAASDSQLLAKSAWGPAELPVHMIVQRMIFHNGMHCGQLADLRRAMGFKRILG